MSVDLSKYEIVGFVDEKISKLVNIEYTGNIYAAPGVIKHIIKRERPFSKDKEKQLLIKRPITLNGHDK